MDTNCSRSTVSTRRLVILVVFAVPVGRASGMAALAPAR
jgi:hypothetical protein